MVEEVWGPPYVTYFPHTWHGGPRVPDHYGKGPPVTHRDWDVLTYVMYFTIRDEGDTSPGPPREGTRSDTWGVRRPWGRGQAVRDVGPRVPSSPRHAVGPGLTSLKALVVTTVTIDRQTSRRTDIFEKIIFVQTSYNSYTPESVS